MTTAEVTYRAHLRAENLTSVSACISTPFHRGAPCSRHPEGFRCKGILDSAYWEARQRVFPHSSPSAWSRTQLKQAAAAEREETSRAGTGRHQCWVWRPGRGNGTCGAWPVLRHGGGGAGGRGGIGGVGWCGAGARAGRGGALTRTGTWGWMDGGKQGAGGALQKR